MLPPRDLFALDDSQIAPSRCSSTIALHVRLITSTHTRLQALLDKIIDYDANGIVTPDLADAIRRITSDPATPKIIDEHANEFYLMDNAA